MDLQIFERFRALIYKESGIVLHPEKITLLDNRIQKRLRELRLKDPGEYFQIIETDASGDELINLIDSISTNVTYFYREPDHFQTLAKVINEWKGAGTLSKLRIWCAAASSGEEPYTIAFTALENIDPVRTELKILGTDICTKVLRKAQEGRYPERELQAVPASARSRFLEVCPDAPGEMFQVKESVQQYLLFKKLNLTRYPYPLRGPLDIIFCRNVMIYFDGPTRQKIVTEFLRLLRPGGYLFLSHSESLLGIEHSLEPCGRSVFRKPSSTTAPRR